MKALTTLIITLIFFVPFTNNNLQANSQNNQQESNEELELLAYEDTKCTDNTSANACALNAKFDISIKGLAVTFKNKTRGDVTDIQWSFGDGKASSDSKVSHTYSEGGMYFFTLTVTSSDGCQDQFEGQLDLFDSPKNARKSVAKKEKNDEQQKKVDEKLGNNNKRKGSGIIDIDLDVADNNTQNRTTKGSGIIDIDLDCSEQK